MSKTVKITKSQISTLINEEVKKLKKIQSLENKQIEIAKQLSEMYDSEELNELSEGLGDKIKNIGNKFGQMMGTKWNQQQAEQAFAQSYAKYAPKMAQQLGIDVNTFKTAIINFMMANGGAAVLQGNGKNAQWNPQTKSFERLSSKMGGANSATGAMMGEDQIVK